jgi:hypothetical protein
MPAPVPAPGVPGFIAGYGPQASDMNTLWADAAAFFQQKVVFRASQTTTATTLPDSGAITTIAYDNVIEDPYSGWSSSTHEWTPPTGYGGWFLISVTVFTASAATAGWQIAVYPSASVAPQSGTGTQVTEAPIATGPSGVCGFRYVYMTGGQDQAWGAAALVGGSSAVSTNLTAGSNSTIEIMWIMA